MVRHEAAEALGSIAHPESLPLMQQYSKDHERVVRESCEVALDLAEYMASDEFEYADALIKVKEGEQQKETSA
jgi:deoxyhypusine monooxygenase